MAEITWLHLHLRCISAGKPPSSGALVSTLRTAVLQSAQPVLVYILVCVCVYIYLCSAGKQLAEEEAAAFGTVFSL